MPEGMRGALAACLLAAACSSDRPPGNDARARDSSAAALPAGGHVFVSNEGSGTITILDPATDSAVATISVGTRPRGIRVSADARTVYVALTGSPRCPPTMPDEECDRMVADKTKDGIGVVDVTSRRLVRVLPGGSDPETFDVSRDGSRIFVSNEDVDSATIVDVASGRILHTVPVGREPEGVRLHPEGR